MSITEAQIILINSITMGLFLGLIIGLLLLIFGKSK